MNGLAEPPGRHPWRRTATLVAVGTAVRLLHSFLLVDYSAYLVSDMLGYWRRAHLHLAGLATGSQEWALWPPLYHVLLAWLFRGLDGLGIGADHRLAATLVAHALLGGASVGAVHVVARAALHRPRLADGVTALYAVTYPIVYVGAFVLSENVAIPLLTFATACVVWPRARPVGLAIGGACLGSAIGVRPALAILVPAFAGHVAVRARGWRRPGPWLAAGGGFLAVVAAVSVGNARLSDGALRGLSRNGGFNFFITQCRVHRVDSIFTEGGIPTAYRIVHPQFADEPWRPWVATDHPPYDEAYYYRRGLECWRADPLALVRNLGELRKLLWGPFFPGTTRVPGFAALDPVFAVLIAGAAVVALVGAPVAWRRSRRRVSPELWLLWSLVPLTLVGAYFYGAERRFFLPVVFAAYVCAASAVTPREAAPGSIEVPVAA